MTVSRNHLIKAQNQLYPKGLSCISMYDYSRRLDLSQAWLPKFVLKISQHFLCTSHKNSEVFFCTRFKTSSKSLKCYQSKRAHSCSLLHLCSDLAKNCSFFGKLHAPVIFGMFYTKSLYLCKLYHRIHIFMQDYPVIPTAKTVYQEERTSWYTVFAVGITG